MSNGISRLWMVLIALLSMIAGAVGATFVWTRGPSESVACGSVAQPLAKYLSAHHPVAGAGFLFCPADVTVPLPDGERESEFVARSVCCASGCERWTVVRTDPGASIVCHDTAQPTGEPLRRGGGFCVHVRWRNDGDSFQVTDEQVISMR